jgi:hypothetical protein
MLYYLMRVKFVCLAVELESFIKLEPVSCYESGRHMYHLRI